MDWGEELYMIQHDMDKEQFEQYSKNRWSFVNSIVRVMVFVGFALLLNYCTGISAHSIPDYEGLAKRAISSVVQEGGYSPEDFRYAGVVIMDVSGCELACNVAIKYHKGWINIEDGNLQPYPTGLGRYVLYAAMVPQISPSKVIDTGNGYYKDSSGSVILDETFKNGGYQQIALRKGVDVSNVCLVKAAEELYNRNMARLADDLIKTGIFFGSRPYADEDTYWDSQAIIGYRTKMSLLESTAWVNALGRPDGDIKMRFSNEDSCTNVIDSIANKAGRDSLLSAMIESVRNGLSKHMNSMSVPVAGITNATIEPDGNQNYGLFAAALWPASNPKFALGVYVLKHKKPAGRLIPAKIARKVIDGIVLKEQEIQEDKGYIPPYER